MWRAQQSALGTFIPHSLHHKRCALPALAHGLPNQFILANAQTFGVGKVDRLNGHWLVIVRPPHLDLAEIVRVEHHTHLDLLTVSHQDGLKYVAVVVQAVQFDAGAPEPTTGMLADAYL